MDLSELPDQDFLRHPWELARATFFAGQLKKAGLSSGPLRLLDVGAGDAWFSGQLAADNSEQETVCWDSGYAKQTPPPRPGMSFSTTRPEGEFDVILMLDVAEHVPNDREFLAEVLSCARPGAHLLFSVPAWPALYSSHDEALRHYRRYRPVDGRDLLVGQGLTILQSGGLFHSLLPLRYLSARAENRPSGKTFSEEAPAIPEDLSWKKGKVLRSLILGALAVDRGLTHVSASAGIQLPGLSWWALCQKA